jgi:hypothetical protein
MPNEITSPHVQTRCFRELEKKFILTQKKLFTRYKIIVHKDKKNTFEIIKI